MLVTNDFPPKLGGIQSYLWELWRRLPPDDVTVLTSRYEGAAEFDNQQAFRVVRAKEWWLLPTPRLIRQINDLADEVGARFVVLDPALPLGLVGPHLRKPYVVIGHGAEFVIPARLPIARQALLRVVRSSVAVIASGAYVERAARSLGLPAGIECVSVPPGVDPQRFHPLTGQQRAAARRRYGVGDDVPLVVGVSRLVPRKGFDRLIRASAQLRSDGVKLQVLIAGKGREAKRLQQLIDTLEAPVRMLGRVEDDDLPELLGAADVFCMPCHDRWMGLEREGFGIVFVEAAAAGVPSVAGDSGGSAEAVENNKTGLLARGKVTSGDVAQAIRRLIESDEARIEMGRAARRGAESTFSYDHLAERLLNFLDQIGKGVQS